MDIRALVDQLLASVGDMWLLAYIGQFFVIVCESAKPKPVDDESPRGLRGLALLGAVLSLFTPILLFLHAFATASGVLIAIFAAILGAVIAATLTGWLIRAVARDVARVLSRAGPVLAIAVFALALYVGWRSAIETASFAISSIAR